jgi:ribosome modulation factor
MDNVDNKFKLPDTASYREGKLARKLGKDKEECPYKIHSYGYAQWMRGFYENTGIDWRID